MGPQHKIIFLKLIFPTTLATFYNQNHQFFLGIIYNMYAIIDDFVYFDNFCYANQITSMLRFLYFIIYYLIPHILWKRIISYLYYPGALFIIHFLKFYEYACHCEPRLCLIVFGCLDICFIVRLFFIKCMLGDILFELTLMFL